MSDPYEGQKNPVVEYAKRRWWGLLIALLAIIFVLQNGLVTGTTKVHLFFWTLDWPVALLLAVVFFAGWFVGWFVSRRKRTPKK